MRTAIYVDGFNLFHRRLEGKANVKQLPSTIRLPGGSEIYCPQRWYANAEAQATT